MKTYQKLFFIKAICLSMFFGIMFTSCRSNEPVSPLEEVHQKMLGQWEAEGWGDNNKRWTITQDSIYNTVYYEGDTLHHSQMVYKLLNDSTVYLIRCWVNRDEPYYAVKTDFHFQNENTLVINDFYQTLAEVYPPQYRPITLKRKK